LRKVGINITARTESPACAVYDKHLRIIIFGHPGNGIHHFPPHRRAERVQFIGPIKR